MAPSPEKRIFMKHWSPRATLTLRDKRTIRCFVGPSPVKAESLGQLREPELMIQASLKAACKAPRVRPSSSGRARALWGQPPGAGTAAARTPSGVCSGALAAGGGHGSQRRRSASRRGAPCPRHSAAGRAHGWDSQRHRGFLHKEPDLRRLTPDNLLLGPRGFACGPLCCTVLGPQLVFPSVLPLVLLQVSPQRF